MIGGVHRLGDRGRPRLDRDQSDARLSGSGDRRTALPAGLASFLNDYYRDHGVEVLPGEKVEAVAKDNGGFTVTTDSGRTLDADVVVAGLGIVPDTELAEAAGLEVDNGIVVDDHGRVGAATTSSRRGDVARFPARLLGTSVRVEHEDNAKSHGKQVGANMAAPTSRTTTCRSSTPTSSTSATRPSRGRFAAEDGRGVGRPNRKGSSPTSTIGDGRAASCSGTSGARSTTRPR